MTANAARNNQGLYTPKHSVQGAREGNLPKWLMGWSRIISTSSSEGNRAKPMGSACTGSNPVVVVS